MNILTSFGYAKNALLFVCDASTDGISKALELAGARDEVTASPFRSRERQAAQKSLADLKKGHSLSSGSHYPEHN